MNSMRHSVDIKISLFWEKVEKIHSLYSWDGEKQMDVLYSHKFGSNSQFCLVLWFYKQ